MASYNKIYLIGNLTRDPELKLTQSGISVVPFTVAVNEKMKDWTEEVTFIDCVAYDKRAELIARYLKKGSPVFVSGRLTSRKWQDKQGNNRISWEVLVGEVVFIGGHESTSAGADVPSAYGGGNQAHFEEIPNDENLPF